MIKEIIFDCFGVLTQDSWLAFLDEYATKDNIDELKYFNYQFDRGNISLDDFVEQASIIVGINKDKAFLVIASSHHPNKKLFTYIRELKESKLDLGIISNVGRELSEYLPDKYLQLFDRITLSYKAGSTKPSPEIYRVHLSKSGYKPDEVVFIDDREINCDGAKALGIKTILFQNFEQTKDELEKLLQ